MRNSVVSNSDADYNYAGNSSGVSLNESHPPRATVQQLEQRRLFAALRDVIANDVYFPLVVPSDNTILYPGSTEFIAIDYSVQGRGLEEELHSEVRLIPKPFFSSDLTNLTWDMPGSISLGDVVGNAGASDSRSIAIPLNTPPGAYRVAVFVDSDLSEDDAGASIENNYAFQSADLDVLVMRRDGVLDVVGTDQKDRVFLTEDYAGEYTRFNITGYSGDDSNVISFDALGRIVRLQVDLIGGDDYVVIESTDAVSRIGSLPPIEVRGGSGNDKIVGGAGSETLSGGSGNDSVYGGAGHDRLNGNGGRDRLYGEAGADRLYGYEGDDILDGGSSGDRQYGGVGMDVCYGGNGNDRFFADDGKVDYLYGSRDTDSADRDSHDVLDAIEVLT